MLLFLLRIVVAFGARPRLSSHLISQGLSIVEKATKELELPDFAFVSVSVEQEFKSPNKTIYVSKFNLFGQHLVSLKGMTFFSMGEGADAADVRFEAVVVESISCNSGKFYRAISDLEVLAGVNYDSIGGHTEDYRAVKLLEAANGSGSVLQQKVRQLCDGFGMNLDSLNSEVLSIKRRYLFAPIAYKLIFRRVQGVEVRICELIQQHGGRINTSHMFLKDLVNDGHVGASLGIIYKGSNAFKYGKVYMAKILQSEAITDGNWCARIASNSIDLKKLNDEFFYRSYLNFSSHPIISGFHKFPGILSVGDTCQIDIKWTFKNKGARVIFRYNTKGKWEISEISCKIVNPISNRRALFRRPIKNLSQSRKNVTQIVAETLDKKFIEESNVSIRSPFSQPFHIGCLELSRVHFYPLDLCL